MTVFMDGNRITPGTEGCKCGDLCCWPCMFRVGITDEPCCPGCAPLPAVDQDDEASA